jgi:hypothetical protein
MASSRAWLAEGRLQSAPFAATGARTSVRSIPFDYADEQIKQKLAFTGRERREHAFVCGACLGTGSPPKLSSLRRQVQLTRPSITVLDVSLDKPFRMEPLDDQARIAGVDTHGFGEAALVYPRLDLEVNKRSVLQLHHLFTSQRFGNHCGADLLKPARERACNPCEGRRAAC